MVGTEQGHAKGPGLFLFLFHVTLPLPRYLISRGMIRPGVAVTT